MHILLRQQVREGNAGNKGKKNPVSTGSNYKIFFDGQFPGFFIRIRILLIIPTYGFLVIAIEKNSGLCRKINRLKSLLTFQPAN